MDNLNDVRVLILAGGKGTRLSSVVSDVPKPMAPLGETPFLFYLIQKLVAANLKKITILTGYKSDFIVDYFGNGQSVGACIDYSHEDSPLGTGGAIKLAIEKSEEEKFLVLNGDTFFDIDLCDFISKSQGNSALALSFQENCSRYGTVNCDKQGVIEKFTEKVEGQVNSYINAGIYFLNRNVVSSIQEGFCSLESEVFPILQKARSLYGVPMGERFIDIGIPEDYYRAKDLLKKWGY
jgi:NDP-sugar pyrophosphorylase family protein